MDAYIPEIRNPTLPYPLLACNVDGIDKVGAEEFVCLATCVPSHSFARQALIGWQDFKHSYDKHNLIFDVPFSGLHRSKRTSKVSKSTLKASLNSSRELPPGVPSDQTDPIFSIVKHFPPSWQRRLQLEHQMVGPVFTGSFESISTMPLC